MKRLTPERESAIRVREFFGAAKRVIEELLFEIEELRLEILGLQYGFEEEEESYEHDDAHEPVYHKFREAEKDRDKLRSILKVEIQDETVKKFFSESSRVEDKSREK